MRQLPISNGLLTFLDELEYTEAALSADPETVHLAAAFLEEITDWANVFQKERQARRAVTRCNAAVAVRDVQLDGLTTRFGGVVLVEAGQDRKSATFRRFFSVAPSEFIRQGLRKQCEATLNKVIPEIAKQPDGNPLRAYEPLLKGAVDAALAALDARSKARGEGSSASNDVNEWKEGVNRLRATTHAELLKIAANKNLGKAWADTFFRSESASEAEPDAPEPV